MREAHVHLPSLGEALAIPKLDDCASLSECLERVRIAAAASASGKLVRLAGARPESWPEARWPSLAELDQAAGGRTCCLLSFDYHTAMANSAALTSAGLAAGERVGENGVVVVDARTGRATGVLLEDAAYRCWQSGPEPELHEREAHVRAALARLASLGFTEAHDLHSPSWLGPTLARLDRASELGMSVWLYPNVRQVEAVHAGRSTWETPRVRLAGGKIFVDGTLNARTAMVLSPFREPASGVSPMGQCMLRPGELDDALAIITRLGGTMHLAAHAIGDGAVRMVLDAIERSGPKREGPARHRIEHAELVDAADVPRFHTLGVVCSVQPCHLLTDIEVLTRQLPTRLDRVLPLRELVQSGCVPGRDLWFGSDAPIVRPEPEDSIQAAVHRRRVGQSEHQAIALDQQLSEREAWACFHGEGRA